MKFESFKQPSAVASHLLNHMSVRSNSRIACSTVDGFKSAFCAQENVIVVITLSTYFTCHCCGQVYFDSPLPPRSSAHLDLASLAFDTFHADASPPPQSTTRSGSLLPLLSNCRIGVALPVGEATTLGSSLFLRSSACFGSFLLVLGLGQLGFVPSTRSSSCSGSSASSLGISCCGFLLLVCDLVQLELAILPRSSSQTGSVMSVSGCAQLDFLAFLQEFLQLDLLLLLCGAAQLEVPSLILDTVNPDALLPPHSFT